MKTATCNVTVNPVIIAAESISLNETMLSLVAEEGTQLTATVLPENATDVNVIWTSSDNEIASVDESGYVTAISAGEATITASVEGTSLSASCTVSVSPKVIAVESITLDTETLALVTEETTQLTATVLPEDATNKTILWFSSDNEVATVDENGLVTAIAPGEATITATVEGTDLTASCTVTVTAKVIAVESITLDNETLALEVEATAQLTATLAPEEAEGNIVWSSSNEEVATIDENGLVTAIAPGEATITATVEGTELTASCTVTVTAKVIAIESITLDNETLALEVEETAQLTAALAPEEAEGTIVWSSSNEEVATVDENGLVTAIAPGEATITATVEGTELTASCTVTVTAKVIAVESITLDNETLALEVEETAQLTATLAPEEAEGNIVWSSSNEEVATVDENGLVTAIAPGEAIITATVEGTEISASCTVTVTAKVIAVESITLDSETLALEVEETAQLTATLAPEEAEGNIIWSSSNEEVATVDENGLVTAIAPGEATITATVEGTEISANCTVTVTAKVIAVESITLDNETLALVAEETAQLTVTVLPEDATNKTIVWSSSNEEVATVDENGLVTAIAPGEAIITATVEGTEISASCTVTVTAKVIAVESITLDNETLALEVEETTQLTATLSPEEAEGNIIWTSSNEEVATVDENGLVTAIAPGEAIITATVEGTELTASCTVTVTAKVIAVESITLDNETLALVAEETAQLNVTLAPEEAKGNITWSSSNEEVATVDENGLVTAIAPGEATITATVEDTELTASCTVTVTEKVIAVESITLDNETLALEVEETAQLTTTVLPEEATNKTIVWTSSNEEVATVDETGLVTAIAPGEATITATVDGTEISVSCTVTVTAKVIAVESITLDNETLALEVEATAQLTATLAPEEAEGTIVWSSSNEEVATVDENGLVTAIAPGEATITATVEGTEISASCTITVTAKVIAVESITLDNETLALEVEETAQLTATFAPEEAEGTILWSSSNEEVATVDENGLVTAIAPGEAIITATVEGTELTASCTITVTAKVIAVESITLDNETLALEVEETAQLTATLAPEEAEGNIVWSSSNEEVATVDENGLVTAIAPGEATITATVEGTEISASCTVTVTAKVIAVESITLDNETLALEVEATAQLTATLAPEEAEGNIIWSSSDNEVATVDENGLVTAIAPGEAIITATVEGTEISASCTVTVTAKVIAVEGITLDNETLALVAEETAQLTATLDPEGAEGNVVWTSSNEEVATVSENGIVTAIAPGEATITATVEGTEISASCTVTVTAKVIAVEGITLDNTELALVEEETAQLTATLAPEEAEGNIVWTSSNEEVATVDENGLVTAIAPGEATITATVEGTEISASCTVTVTSKVIAVESITLDNETLALEVEETAQLTATLAPEEAEGNIVWSSSNEEVATVDENGLVTAIAPGEAIITATVEGTEISASCTVTVTAKVIAVESITLDNETLALEVEETAQLTATLAPEEAEGNIVWSSSDNEVATVDENGLVTAIAPGEAIITATVEGTEISASCTVTVSAKVIAVESISLDNETLALEVEETAQLTATLAPEEAEGNIVWSSSNEEVATVDETGLVTAIAPGEAIITATVEGTEISASCTVTVTAKAIAVQSITLDTTEATLIDGETLTLTATVLPEDATNKEVVWTSSDTKIATVQNGVVTAKAPGEVIITAAWADDASIAAECHLTVQPIYVETIALNKTQALVEVGNTLQLRATVAPTNASIKQLEWTSSDTHIATVENGLVTSHMHGNVTITARTTDGSNLEATCQLTAYYRGDADANGEVDVNDLSLIANIILERNTQEYLMEAVDLNGDTKVDVSDLAAVANIILHYDGRHAPSRNEGEALTELTLPRFIDADGTTQVTVPMELTNPDTEVTSFQTDLVLPQGMRLQSVQLDYNRADDQFLMTSALDDQTVRILCYSMSGQQFAGQSGAVAQLTFTLSDALAHTSSTLVLANTILSDRGNRLTADDATSTLQVGEVTAIDQIGTDATDALIYNINGTRKSHITTGINIIRRADGTTLKSQNE